MFRRRSVQSLADPPGLCGDGAEPGAAPPDALAPPDARDTPDTPDGELSAEASGELERVASRFGLAPWDYSSPRTLAEAIQQADELWAAPGAGEVQRGVEALFGGRAPATLIGIHLWPTLTAAGSAPALLLADIRHRVHAVVDVAHSPSGHAPRPGWVAAAAIAYGPHMPGSHSLWRHWQLEVSDHAPHQWSPACEDHTHLARPDVRGNLVTGVPQHDAWMMSRSWLSPERSLPSVADVHWLVLSATDRPLWERDRQIRSRWDVVSFGRFASVVAAAHEDNATLPTSTAAVLRMMLPSEELR